MADKQLKKFHTAVFQTVERHDMTDVRLTFYYKIEGREHTTHVEHELLITFGDMVFMGGQFHYVMDELLTEWHKAKKTLSEGHK